MLLVNTAPHARIINCCLCLISTLIMFSNRTLYTEPLMYNITTLQTKCAEGLALLCFLFNPAPCPFQLVIITLKSNNYTSNWTTFRTRMFNGIDICKELYLLIITLKYFSLKFFMSNQSMKRAEQKWIWWVKLSSHILVVISPSALTW